MTTSTKLTSLVAFGRLAFGVGLIAAPATLGGGTALAGLLLYAALDR